MIAAELRLAILSAAGHGEADPLLRPGPEPGSYESSLPFRLAQGSSRDPRDIAAALTTRPGTGPRIAAAEATGPGSPAPRAAVIARYVLEIPAYAVRYAHAAAAAVLRWAAALGTGPAGPEEFRPHLLTEPSGSAELALLDGSSWLPEQVAMAACRGRPDEFAGYLEGLAARTIETMSTTGFTTISSISSERLWLADAARTGLAAGLELLGVSVPRRL